MDINQMQEKYFLKNSLVGAVFCFTVRTLGTTNTFAKAMSECVRFFIYLLRIVSSPNSIRTNSFQF